MNRFPSRFPQLLTLLLLAGCSTAGSTWMRQAETVSDDEESPPTAPIVRPDLASDIPSARPRRRVIGEVGEVETEESSPAPRAPGGRVIGTFRNTYYDVPSESDYTGQTVSLKNARCKSIKDVPRGFFEAVCVQGSGTLTSGSTVSFARRDCDCADTCPRTGQRICFDLLDRREYPWGRGASGGAITPLLTVAVDSNVIPLNTPIYVPEFDGLPRDPSGSARHDGCFLAQDRGVKVQGKHVDIFTGEHAITQLWNRLVPSNKGVTVILESPHCARATEY